MFGAMKWLSLIKSSFHDIRCCDENTQVAPATAWRARSSSLTCVIANGTHTGYVNVGTLEEYTVSTGVATGNTKPNVSTDPDYIPNYIDTNMCSVGQSQPSYGYMTIYNSGVVGKGLIEIQDNGSSYDRSVTPNSVDTFQVPYTANASLSVNFLSVNGLSHVDFTLYLDATPDPVPYASAGGVVNLVNITLPNSIWLVPIGGQGPAPKA